MNSYELVACPIREHLTWYQYYFNIASNCISPLEQFIDTHPIVIVMIMPICICFILMAMYENVMAYDFMKKSEKSEKSEKDDVFKNILDQVGEDKESWPVMLVNEMINIKNMVNQMKEERY